MKHKEVLYLDLGAISQITLLCKFKDSKRQKTTTTNKQNAAKSKALLILSIFGQPEIPNTKAWNSLDEYIKYTMQSRRSHYKGHIIFNPVYM